jgi:signal transduction histidine kinase
VTESGNAQNDVTLETSIPQASLESILCTEELQRRGSRPPDYGKENRALVSLVSALADSPRTILQTLADTILEITESDSAGLSLLTRDDGGGRFYWPAIAGMWSPHVGGGTPRNFGPCGDVLDRNCTLLFTHFERRYPYLIPVMPPADECLLVPFYVGGRAVGTVWAIMHSNRRKFDAEDERVMGSLGRFASSAYQALVSIDALKLQVAAREKAERAVRELANGLEAQVQVRTQELLRASEALREAQSELAHVNRVTTMGQLAASISHEVMQPITAGITNAQAALSFLRGQEPELDEAKGALGRVIEAGNRAAEIMARIRAMFKKAPPRKEALNINEAILGVVTLTRGEAMKNRVSLETRLADGLPIIQADRVQLQQVMLNLIVNGMDAMNAVSAASRQLLITTREDASGGVVVAVQDSGPGVSPEAGERIFDAFYTTKAAGMGMGLSISRTIIEQHGGRIWSARKDTPGATIEFSLPGPTIEFSLPVESTAFLESS